jgi:DNA polymerase-3 subunit epsilon
MATVTDDRTAAIVSANQVLKSNPVFLDTETTGLSQKDEIVEIAVIDNSGLTLIDSFVKPSRLIPADATNIHGITDQMVQKAPAWPILWVTRIKPLLTNRTIVAYNSDFDKGMIEQANARYQIKVRENLVFFDLLKLYSQFRGEWDGERRSYRFFSLDEAGKSSGISLPNAHRAVADTLLARELLFYIAGVKP